MDNEKETKNIKANSPARKSMVTKRKQAEGPAELHLLVLQSMAEAVNYTDSQGVIRYTNPALDRMFGYAPGELIGQPVSVINALPPEENARLVTEVMECVLGEGAWDGEFLNRRKDGTVFYTRGRVTGMPYAGEIWAVGILEDISERKRMEGALRFTRVSLDTAADTMVCVDRDARFVDVNEAFCRTSGYSREELLRMTVHDIDPDFSAEVWSEFWEKLKRSGSLTFESNHRIRDGKTHPVEITATFFEYKGKEYHSAFARDITERKNAERQLRELNTELESRVAERTAQLQNVIAFAPVVIYAMTPDFVPTWVSANIETILGYSVAESLLPGWWASHLHPDDRPRILAEVDRMWIHEDDQFSQEYRFQLNDGLYHWINDTLRVVRDPRSNALEIVGAWSDITERKQTEAELIAAKQQAEAANRAKSEFLARMSHELRTPLNAIIGFAQVMQAVPDDEALGAHRDSLDTIIRSGWHLLRVIEDILNLSAIEANKVVLNFENIDVHSSIQDYIDLLMPLASERNIQLSRIDDACAGLIIWADPFRFKQVLINLLANAIKYNRDGGRVTVSCQHTPGRARILVTDTGEGIPESEIFSLFRPFSRLTQRPYTIQGAGIGLSIAKQLTELMGGAIGVESEYGKGSTFWVEFPAVEVQVAVAASVNNLLPPLNDETAGSQATLLYIEDNPDHINLVRQIVSRMGNLLVLTAHTPSLGLDLARTRQPDLILLDICLQGMNGYQVLELLQADERTCKIPVIAISASAFPAEIEKGLRAGFRRYLTKPLNVREFRNIVEELLRDNIKRPD